MYINIIFSFLSLSITIWRCNFLVIYTLYDFYIFHCAQCENKEYFYILFSSSFYAQKSQNGIYYSYHVHWIYWFIFILSWMTFRAKRFKTLLNLSFNNNRPKLQQKILRIFHPSIGKKHLVWRPCITHQFCQWKKDLTCKEFSI